MENNKFIRNSNYELLRIVAMVMVIRVTLLTFWRCFKKYKCRDAQLLYSSIY